MAIHGRGYLFLSTVGLAVVVATGFGLVGLNDGSKYLTEVTPAPISSNLTTIWEQFQSFRVCSCDMTGMSQSELVFLAFLFRSLLFQDVLYVILVLLIFLLIVMIFFWYFAKLSWMTSNISSSSLWKDWDS